MQDIKFLWSKLLLGRAVHRRHQWHRWCNTDDNTTRRTEHDCIGSLPYEPKVHRMWWLERLPKGSACEYQCVCAFLHQWATKICMHKSSCQSSNHHIRLSQCSTLHLVKPSLFCFCVCTDLYVNVINVDFHPVRKLLLVYKVWKVVFSNYLLLIDLHCYSRYEVLNVRESGIFTSQVPFGLITCTNYCIFVRKSAFCYMYCCIVSSCNKISF